MGLLPPALRLQVKAHGSNVAAHRSDPEAFRHLIHCVGMASFIGRGYGGIFPEARPQRRLTHAKQVRNLLQVEPARKPLHQRHLIAT